MMAKENGKRPRTGQIQCVWKCDVQPYQKKVMGRQKLNQMLMGRRISGSNTPPLAFVCRTTVLSENAVMTAQPARLPKPRQMYTRPVTPMSQWYVSRKTMGMVVKRRSRSVSTGTRR